MSGNCYLFRLSSKIEPPPIIPPEGNITRHSLSTSLNLLRGTFYKENHATASPLFIFINSKHLN